MQPPTGQKATNWRLHKKLTSLKKDARDYTRVLGRAPSADVLEAYDRAMDAAAKLDNIDEVADQVQQLLESTESSATLFVRQSLAVS